MKSLNSQHILFEDNHLIAINKPAGILVQGDITGDKSLDILVKEYIKKKYNSQYKMIKKTLPIPIYSTCVACGLSTQKYHCPESGCGALVWRITSRRPNVRRHDLTIPTVVVVKMMI